jgi:magnesium transporter
MITTYRYLNNECVHPSLDEVLAIAPSEYASDSLLWIDLESPDPEDEHRILVEWFGVNELVLEDIHRYNDPDDERGWRLHPPKAEEYPNYLFLIYRSLALPARSEDEELRTYLERVKNMQVNVLVNDGVVITHRLGQIASIDRVHVRVQANPWHMRRGPDFMAAMVADSSVDDLFTLNDLVSDSLEETEQSIMRNSNAVSIVRLQRGRRQLQQYRLSTTRMSEMMGRMARGHLAFVDNTEVAFFRDVHDHTVQAQEQIEQLLQEADNLIELHFAINNSYLNEVMRRLTVLSTIFLPITFITSWYGMNFAHMPELHWGIAYPLVLVLVLVIAGGLMNLFRKRGWLA